MMHISDMIWQKENGGATKETLYQCCIMRKVLHKEVATGGVFYFSLDSAIYKTNRTI